jgi:hypothetical protein
VTSKWSCRQRENHLSYEALRLRLLRETLQGQCADEIGQPVDERLVDFRLNGG